MARIVTELAADPAISSFVDASLPCPEPYRGAGPIQLIILGQDPTVEKSASRQRISKVLNLDRHGPLRAYVGKLCLGLGTSLEGVYATNLVKNFSAQQPNPHVLQAYANRWRKLLQEELAAFSPQIPIVTLGQPVLKLIVNGNAPRCLRDYWGYESSGKPVNRARFRILAPEENALGRLVLPFPHQQSTQKQFYLNALPFYLVFAKSRITHDPSTPVAKSP
jgi:hypothetical protein